MAIDTSSDPQGSLQRKTNWWGAFVIGLAGTLLVTGIGPYAVQGMGAASIPVFILVTAAAMVLCFCLAELAAMMPQRTGGLVENALRAAMNNNPSLESRRRLEQLLARVKDLAPEKLQILRAMEVLEYAASDEARHVLSVLAEAGAGHWLTDYARQAPQRVHRAKALP